MRISDWSSDVCSSDLPAELAEIAAARSKQVTSDGWRQAFRWPVTGRLSGFFGSQRVYQGKPGSYHSGTDVAVPAGTPFVAPAAGVVVLAASAPFTLEGTLLIVDHGMGLSRDRMSTRLNSSPYFASRLPSSAFQNNPT